MNLSVRASVFAIGLALAAGMLILGKPTTTLAAPSVLSSPEAQSLCGLAIINTRHGLRWDRSSRSSRAVAWAKGNGLTPRQCEQIALQGNMPTFSGVTGFGTQVKGDTNSTGPLSSAKQELLLICRMATRIRPTLRWEDNVAFSKERAKAQRRGLTLSDCSRLFRQQGLYPSSSAEIAAAAKKAKEKAERLEREAKLARKSAEREAARARARQARIEAERLRKLKAEAEQAEAVARKRVAEAETARRTAEAQQQAADARRRAEEAEADARRKKAEAEAVEAERQRQAALAQQRADQAEAEARRKTAEEAAHRQRLAALTVGLKPVNIFMDVAVSTATMRNLPERVGQQLKRVEKGEQVHVVAMLPSGWVQIAEEGEPVGWMHRGALRASASTASTSAPTTRAAASPLYATNYPFPEAKPNPNGIAVIVGSRTYRHGDVPEVSFAHNDAEAIRQYVVKTLGFEDRNVVVLRDASELYPKLGDGLM